jgi:hypothetical protein
MPRHLVVTGHFLCSVELKRTSVRKFYKMLAALEIRFNSTRTNFFLTTNGIDHECRHQLSLKMHFSSSRAKKDLIFVSTYFELLLYFKNVMNASQSQE